MDPPPVTVIGGGLAGCEAAWQLVRAGLAVRLIEARPAVMSPAHRSLLLGELVCSNSLRSDAQGTASELLKAEMRRVGSLVMEAADTARVPAGSALAVDRTAFAWRITSRLVRSRLLFLQRRSVDRLPERPAILASGPLTSAGLSNQLSRTLGRGLHFYDAIAPIVDAEGIEWSRVFRGARRDPANQDYVNCPLQRPEYDRFVEALRTGRQTVPHPFEQQHYFEGCLPLEVMASRGDDVLAYGPLRPVGLTDPRTGKRPHAVVQLRAENLAGTCYNLVGFQTRLVHEEQRRIFRMIPGLERVRFLRYGSIHRNTYIDSPRLVDSRLALIAAPHVMVAGQITGVEGYLESAAMGLVAGLFMAGRIRGCAIDSPPLTTALGALVNHVTRQRARDERFEPSNITFGLLPPLESRVARRRERRLALRTRALDDLRRWLEQIKPLLNS